MALQVLQKPAVSDESVEEAMVEARAVHRHYDTGKVEVHALRGSG